MKQKPKNLDETGCEVSEYNGTRSYRNTIRVNELTKYDLRNYSEKDALALRIAYLADKTWHRIYIPYGSSSADGTQKMIGHRFPQVEGKPLLNSMLEKISSLLKRKYSENPEGLKGLISDSDLNKEETDDCIRYHKKQSPFLRTASRFEVDNHLYECAKSRQYIKPEEEGIGQKEACALRLGRLYLSDIAKRAYSELTEDNSFSKENSFVEQVLPSEPKTRTPVPNLRVSIPESQRALWGLRVYDNY